jgi:hypothetical protein
MPRRVSNCPATAGPHPTLAIAAQNAAAAIPRQ